jgi:hypothetical protein
MRILSLLPSATEIVYALGLGEHLVGVTDECDWPPQARRVRVVSRSALPAAAQPAEIDRLVSASVGGGQPLYRLDTDAIRDLRPDLVLSQDLCGVCARNAPRSPPGPPRRHLAPHQSVTAAERMIRRHLHDADAQPVRVGDPHLQQSPRFPPRLPQDANAAFAELLSCRGQVAHLQPQRHAGRWRLGARPDSSRNPPPRKKTVPRSGPSPNSR